MILQPTDVDAVLRGSTPGAVLSYFIQSERGGPVKIGKSIDPLDRLATFQTAHAYPLRIVHLSHVPEARLHKRWRAHHIRGEWFEPHPEMLNTPARFAPRSVLDGVATGIDTATNALRFLLRVLR